MRKILEVFLVLGILTSLTGTGILEETKKTKLPTPNEVISPQSNDGYETEIEL